MIYISFIRRSLVGQVDEDEPLFLSLISDLFPGIQLDNASYDELQIAISEAVDSELLVNHPSWNLKVIQVSQCFLFEAGGFLGYIVCLGVCLEVFCNEIDRGPPLTG